MQITLLQTAQGTHWPDAMIAIAGIALVTIVAAVAIWQGLGTWRARIAVAREDAYRQLAERTSAAEASLAEQQAHTVTQLRAINERLAGIEKVLREVE